MLIMKENTTDIESHVMTGFLPIADFLNFLSDLVSPERDEEHDTFAYLTLKQHRSDKLVLHSYKNDFYMYP